MKFIQKNKKAYFDYEILEEFTAGIVLTGPEVKSIRAGQINLKSAYVSILNNAAWLKNANITRYPYDSNQAYEPFRDRKLLLKQSELERLAGKLNTQGVSLIPLAVGFKGAYAKLLIGLVRGKKKHDKRQVLKNRAMQREAQRAIRGRK